MAKPPRDTPIGSGTVRGANIYLFVMGVAVVLTAIIAFTVIRTEVGHMPKIVQDRHEITAKTLRQMGQDGELEAFAAFLLRWDPELANTLAAALKSKRR